MGTCNRHDNENSVSTNAGYFFISRGTISFVELDGKKPNRLLYSFKSWLNIAAKIVLAELYRLLR